MTSPLASVPKKEATSKARIINDQSRSGVNENLPTPPVTLPMIEDVLRRIYANAYLVESDFKDHFYHYYVCEEDRRYLGLQRPYGKGLSRWNRLPMGARTSPHHCSALTAVWEDCLMLQPPFCGETVVNVPGTRTFDPSLPHLYRRAADGTPAADAAVYVDDLCGWAPTKAAGMQAIRSVVVRGGNFGFVCKYSKLKGPKRTGRAFHGFVIDTRPELGGPRVLLRDDARQNGLDLIARALASRGTIPRRTLAQLVGKLLSMAPAVPHGVTFLRRLWDSLHALHLPLGRRPGKRYDVLVALDEEHCKDLVWWQQALSDHSGVYLLRNKDVRLRVHYTDGSGYGTGGCSHEFTHEALPKVEYFSGLWRGEVTSMTSNWKELRSILTALRRERLSAERQHRRTALWRTRIYHLTDNLVSETILHKGASTSPRLQQLLREIALELRLQQCDLVPMHVAGKRLIAQGTDGLSRGQTSAGALSGTATDVKIYNPLCATPAPMPGALRAWAEETYGMQRELWHPRDWTAANVRGKDTLWMPPPLLARDALTCVLKQHMIAPTTTAATFLLPRRYTAPWRRLLRRFQTQTVRAGATERWPADEFEPLIIARLAPWTPQQVPIKKLASTMSFRSSRRCSGAGSAETSSTGALPWRASTASCASSREDRGSRFRRVAATTTPRATASPKQIGRQCSRRRRTRAKGGKRA